jgi:hydroxyacylglutathione hydrolase
MIVSMNTGGVAMTNCYLVADETTMKAVIFDAPDHTVAPLLEEAAKRGWEVIGLWLTHGHFDHYADHAEVKRRFPKAQILIHELDAAKAKNPERQIRMFGLPFAIPPVHADAFVVDKQVLQFGSAEVHVIHTPGHAPGHVCYHLPAAKLLIGGDLIIGGSVGRTDLPDSNHAALEDSVRRIMQLPGETQLLGGHGEVSTLDEEREHNPFVAGMLKRGKIA